MGGLVLVALAFAMSHDRRAQRPSTRHQVIMGASCGAVGGLVVATRYGDVIPDRLERPLGAVVALLLLGAGGWYVRRRILARDATVKAER